MMNRRLGRSGDSILIVTEGRETEPQYFRALKNILRSSFVIERGSGGSFDDIYNLAVKKWEERNQESKRKDYIVPYDEVWIVVDSEEVTPTKIERLDKLIDKTKKTKIKLALSYPSFEYWLLLHYVLKMKPYTNADKVIEELRCYIPGYSKNIDNAERMIKEKIKNAIYNAEQCRRNHENRDTEHSVPYTDVDLLVRCLNESTREHLRLF